MEPLEAQRLPWAQGVVSSNLAAPTSDKPSPKGDGLSHRLRYLSSLTILRQARASDREDS